MLVLEAFMVVIIAGTTLAAAPEKEPVGTDFKEELDEIRMASETGRADAVSERLGALAEKLKASEIPAAAYARTAQMALRTALWSPVAENPMLRDQAAKVALEVLASDKTKSAEDPEVLGQRLQIALDLLPRTSAPAERTATAALQGWVDVLKARAHYLPYDPVNPKVKLEIPVPPRGYDGPFVFGMDPKDITDPKFRQEYSEFLKRRDDFNRMSDRFVKVSNLQEQFLPKLKQALKAAYADVPQTRAAGIALVEKYVDDREMRKQLLAAIGDRPEPRPEESGSSRAERNEW